MKVFLLRLHYIDELLSLYANWPMSSHKDIGIFSSKEAAEKYMENKEWYQMKVEKNNTVPEESFPFAEIVEFELQ